MTTRQALIRLDAVAAALADAHGFATTGSQGQFVSATLERVRGELSEIIKGLSKGHVDGHE